MHPSDEIKPGNSGGHPEFVELPARGGDRICGLSRSWWYGREREGLIRLARVRTPGNVRAGRVLLPVGKAVALIHRLANGAENQE